METAVMKIREQHIQIGVALGLIALAVGLRLAPHPANFAPVAAIAIFGGAVLPRKLALWVPLLAMMVSDAIIGVYSIMPIIWACYALIALASTLWLHKPTLIKGATLTVASSFFFFIVTNFAVWAFDSMYAHTWAGLAQCYYMALPFFRSTFMSDLLYTTLLFGLFAFATAAARHLVRIAHQHA